MKNKQIIIALKKIKEMVSKIDTGSDGRSYSLKNQLIGYCEGLIEGLENDKDEK